MQPGYLGIDVGSVSTNVVLLDGDGQVVFSLYLRTRGQPIRAIKEGLVRLADELPPGFVIGGAGATGSGRVLAGAIVGADIVKNEITAHSVAACHFAPGVQTILEIGGQDSKIIILRQEIVHDFAMNTVCAAGTGSFLDQQAARLSVPIEEFGGLALKAKNPVRIAGRCTVFAESDMIHKQQMGHSMEDIVAGLCEALVRNYLNNVAKGKEILPPVLFQGGVAANAGIRAAFAAALKQEIIVPEHFAVMGAVGAAILARERVKRTGATHFKGLGVSHQDYFTDSFHCQGCSNLCEIVNIRVREELIARWGSRCGKWDML